MINEDGLIVYSNPLERQVGKAGEHIVCANLLLQGFNAFLTDQMMPYDIVVDYNGKLIKIQVKTTRILKNYAHSRNIYRYYLRRGISGKHRVKIDDIHIFAFVALDRMKIGYLPIIDCQIEKGGATKQTVDIKTRDAPHISHRMYSTGKQRSQNKNGLYIEDIASFEKAVESIMDDL